MRSIQENKNLKHTENEVEKKQMCIQILRVKHRNLRGQEVIFTINIYRTKNQLFNTWTVSPKTYSGDTTRDTLTDANKQNHNRYVWSATGKDA